MKIEDVMTRDVVTCRPVDPLSVAAQQMWDRDCGCIPVLSEDGSKRVVGMLTDRDICMATHFRGVAPGAVRVGDVMSKIVRSIGPGESTADAEAVMSDVQVRRLPVVDEEGSLVGLISLADLARVASGRRGAKKRDRAEHDVGEALAAICEVRSPSPIVASA